MRGQCEHPGEKGGDATGPNPTDRARPGTKRHLIVDRQGIPLAVLLTGANRHDSIVFEAVLDAIHPIRTPSGQRRKRPTKVHADKAYDIPRCRRFLHRRRIDVRIARRGVESSERLGRHRWVVERTFAWLNRSRRLAIRYERRIDIHQAFSLPRLFQRHHRVVLGVLKSAPLLGFEVGVQPINRHSTNSLTPPTPEALAKLALMSRQMPAEAFANETQPPRPRNLRRRLSPQTIDDLVARYKAGEKTPALSKAFDISESGVRELIRAEGVTLRGHAITPEDAEHAVRLYESGLTITAVVAEIGYSHGTIRTALLRRGVALRSGGPRKQELPIE